MNKRSDIWYLVGAGLLFGLFLLNIFLGKAALLLEKEPILAVGDVGEFLLLLAAVIFFVIVALLRETRQSDEKTRSANRAEEDNQ